MALFALGIGGQGFTQIPPSSASPCQAQVFEGDRFLICPFDPASQEFRLVDTNEAHEPLRSLSALKEALGEAARRVRFAMNAGMFDDHGRPIGLYVENGTVLHPLNTRSGLGNFYLKPNGVFSLDRSGRVRIETSEAWRLRHGRVLWASQSGPMLVIAGALNPQIQSDGPSLHIRNGVGVLPKGQALFVISEDAVLAKRLISRSIGTDVRNG